MPSNLNVLLPRLRSAKAVIRDDRTILYLGAYGCEDRNGGWLQLQRKSSTRKTASNSMAVLLQRTNGGEADRTKELASELHLLGFAEPVNIPVDSRRPDLLEAKVVEEVLHASKFVQEVVLDISSMSKLMILASLTAVVSLPLPLRLVYSEAVEYAPSKAEFREHLGLRRQNQIGKQSIFPNQGAIHIARLPSMISTTMQGQPVTLIGFTSFNEHLLAHTLGTISPMRLILIGGRPPRKNLLWREKATEEVACKFIEAYATNNKSPSNGRLTRTTSTLDYRETVEMLSTIYNSYGLHDRVVCVATGSKMQTVGLFFAKNLHPDIHVEYPAPSGYRLQDYSNGVGAVHELLIRDPVRLFTDLFVCIHARRKADERETDAKIDRIPHD